MGIAGFIRRARSMGIRQLPSLVLLRAAALQVIAFCGVTHGIPAALMIFFIHNRNL
jgi:hypothetical protein